MELNTSEPWPMLQGQSLLKFKMNCLKQNVRKATNPRTENQTLQPNAEAVTTGTGRAVRPDSQHGGHWMEQRASVWKDELGVSNVASKYRKQIIGPECSSETKHIGNNLVVIGDLINALSEFDFLTHTNIWSMYIYMYMRGRFEYTLWMWIYMDVNLIQIWIIKSGEMNIPSTE